MFTFPCPTTWRPERLAWIKNVEITSVSTYKLTYLLTYVLSALWMPFGICAVIVAARTTERLFVTLRKNTTSTTICCWDCRCCSRRRPDCGWLHITITPSVSCPVLSAFFVPLWAGLWTTKTRRWREKEAAKTQWPKGILACMLASCRYVLLKACSHHGARTVSEQCSETANCLVQFNFFSSVVAMRSENGPLLTHFSSVFQW